MKKKLLFINGHLNTGGVEKSLLDILSHLDYKKYDVDLLLLEQLGDYAKQVPKNVKIVCKSIEKTHGPLFKVIKDCYKNKDWFSLKMRLIFLTMKLFGQKRVTLAKKMLTDNKKYDCVIGFRAGFCSQVAAYAVNADKRITWWHHGELDVDYDSYLEVATEFDHIVAVSDYCNKVLCNAFPAISNKIITIHNIIDSDTIISKAKAFNPGYEATKVHIVSVGRFSAEKHFDNAIYAAKTLKEHGYNFQWHLVGDGILRKELESLVAELGVDDCFKFEGNQVNPYPYIKHADLFVHPSYVESFGLVVAEALTLNIPCVVTKSEGVTAFLKDEINCVLTEKNPESLIRKVITVLEKKELAVKLKAGSFCPQQIDLESIMSQINCLIEE